jgi:hypothetical protein
MKEISQLFCKYLSCELFWVATSKILRWFGHELRWGEIRNFTMLEVLVAKPLEMRRLARPRREN